MYLFQVICESQLTVSNQASPDNCHRHSLCHCVMVQMCLISLAKCLSVCLSVCVCGGGGYMCYRQLVSLCRHGANVFYFMGQVSLSVCLSVCLCVWACYVVCFPAVHGAMLLMPAVL